MERSKDSKEKAPPKKQDHHNKVWYKKFEDLVNCQHAHGGRTYFKRRENTQLRYWVEHQQKIYHQFLRDENTPSTLERKSALENIGFVWTDEKGSVDKGPICKGKKTRSLKKGNMRLSIVHYGK